MQTISMAKLIKIRKLVILQLITGAECVHKFSSEIKYFLFNTLLIKFQKFTQNHIFYKTGR